MQLRARFVQLKVPAWLQPNGVQPMTTTSVYEVPDNPADVEAAALDLLAHMPGEVFNAPDAMTAVLQEFCGMLQLEGRFAGLTWDDAKNVAAAACTAAGPSSSKGTHRRRRAGLQALIGNCPGLQVWPVGESWPCPSSSPSATLTRTASFAGMNRAITITTTSPRRLAGSAATKHAMASHATAPDTSGCQHCKSRLVGLIERSVQRRHTRAGPAL